MKPILITALIVMGLAHTSSYAQGNSRGYTDDVYYTAEDAENDADAQAREQRKQREENEQQEQRQNTYNSSNGDQTTYADGGDEYIDYSDDDFQYATNIRRFNYPFYNMGYYSGFYSPYWYDPFWSDPYWGWSPWARPGFSVSFGMGPYWSSYGGWYNWYGYSGFASAYNYPYYAGGWGYNNYWGYGGGYYSGYWNGYYAGLGSTRNVTYGPRNSMNSFHNSVRPNSSGFRAYTNNSALTPRYNGNRVQSGSPTTQPNTRPRTLNQQNSTMSQSNAPVRGGAIQQGQRPTRSRFGATESTANEQRYQGSNINSGSSPQMQESGRRQRFSAPQQSQSPQRLQSAPSNQPQRSISQPQRTAPQRSYSAPQRSYSAPSGGSRSFGGSSGGGRSMGGGRR